MPSDLRTSASSSRMRGMWRLIAVIAQILRGLWLIYVRFGGMTPAQRRATVQQWSVQTVRACGLRMEVHGNPAQPQPGRGILQVANHVSWIDITALHAVGFCRFVSKDEVHHWPVVGTLADCAETLYLQRGSRRAAARMLHVIADALRGGDTVAIFPEGTTSDGRSLLPFHANLLQAAISADAPVQPVALQFVDAQGRISLSPCYIGDDSLIASLWRTLCDDGVVVCITYGPLQTANGRTRQQWSDELHATIAQMLQCPAPFPHPEKPTA